MAVPDVDSEGLQLDTRFKENDGLQADHSQNAPEVNHQTDEQYHNGHDSPATASDTNSLEGYRNSVGKEKYTVVPAVQAVTEQPDKDLPDIPSHSRKQKICGIRRRWFWLALVGGLVIVVAVASGVGGALAGKHGKTTGKSTTATPTAPAATTPSAASATSAISNGSKLAATAFNDTNSILQYRVYYQDTNDNIRESSWNASSKTWYVSNESVGKAKSGSPIAVAASGLPEFSTPQINLYTLDSSNEINEWTNNPSKSSSTWSPGSLNVQAASDSNLAAVAHSHPGCIDCYNDTVVFYQDSSNKLNTGHGNSSGWTWTTLTATPIANTGLGIALKWYPDDRITGIRIYYQDSNGMSWDRWDLNDNQTDPAFSNWIYGGNFTGSSSSSNTSVAAFAYGTNTTTGLPANIEILSSSSHGVTNYPWLGATDIGAFEDTQTPLAMHSLDTYTPIAANGDGRVYGIESGVIKEFVVSTDGKSTWTLVGNVTTS